MRNARAIHFDQFGFQSVLQHPGNILVVHRHYDDGAKRNLVGIHQFSLKILFSEFALELFQVGSSSFCSFLFSREKKFDHVSLGTFRQISRVVL